MDVMDDFQPGDILACYGTDAAARSITRWTSWTPCAWRWHLPPQLRRGPSHVGIITTSHLPNEAPLLVESTTFCDHPCLIRGRVVTGCQAHWPEQRIDDYVSAGGHVDVYRIDPDLYRLIDVEALSHFFRGFVFRGIGYDMSGAIVSGGSLARWLFADSDLNKVFCSELIARGLMAFSLLNYDVPSRFHPARLLRDLAMTAVYRFQRRHDAALTI